MLSCNVVSTPVDDQQHSPPGGAAAAEMAARRADDWKHEARDKGA